MANEAEIINNPTQNVETPETGYQRQNTLAVAARVGMDETVVVGGTGECTLQVSGPVDVNGVLYTIQSAVTFTLVSEGNYVIYLSGTGDNLTPTITTTPGSFDADRNAHYTDADDYRILNWLIQYDGTTAIAYKVGRDTFDEWITSAGTWTCMFTRVYEIWVTGKGGDGGDMSVNNFTGSAGGGGAGLTGYKKIYIEAGDKWTSVFSATSGGNTSISDGTTTLTAQNGYDAPNASSDPGSGGDGGSTNSGFDIILTGSGGGCGIGGEGGGGNGGNSFYTGSGRGGFTGTTSPDSENGLNAGGYGSGGGGGAARSGGSLSATGGTGASGVIRIIG